MLLWVALLLPLVPGACFSLPQYDRQKRKLNSLNELLFPNRSYEGEIVDMLMVPQSISSGSHRKLTSTLPPPADLDTSGPCSTCSGLKYCSVLNSFILEERYYDTPQPDVGSCQIIEQLGERMSGEIFGVGATFRDTVQCREIVLQYLCLFWGSQNQMYRNYCYWQEVVDKTNQLIAARPPCRSFCVQISEICANEPEFLQLCGNIACPPFEDECTPDPKVDGQLIDAGIGCKMPFLRSPYGAAIQSFSLSSGVIIASLILAAVNWLS